MKDVDRILAALDKLGQKIDNASGYSLTRDTSIIGVIDNTFERLCVRLDAMAEKLEAVATVLPTRRNLKPENPHMAQAQQAMDTFRDRYPATPPCTRPPPGWKCTRRAHADGPCAALPDTSPRKPSSGRKRDY